MKMEAKQSHRSGLITTGIQIRIRDSETKQGTKILL